MFGKKLFERLFASLPALLFLAFSMTTGLVMTSPVHAASMTSTAVTSSAQDHAEHLGYTADNKNTIDDSYGAQEHGTATMASHTNNACAALCQTNTTTKTDLSLPVSEKEDEDDIFDDEEANRSSYCLPATNDLAPVYKERKLKVPLYLKNCLLRI